MELIILGAHGGWPTAGGASAGYLVRHDGFNLWMDLGTGTMANLQRHVGLTDVHALYVSHPHPDHFLDIYPLFLSRFYREDALPPVPLFAPPGFFDLAVRLVSEEMARDMRSSFDVREVEPGAGFEIGPFRAETRPMRHPVVALGLRLEAAGSVLAYTGDTGPTEEVENVARGADVLLSEATWQDGKKLPPIHLYARQAGQHAARAAAGRLVLTHIWPTLDREVSREQASEAFRGEIVLAHEGLRVEVHQ